MTDFNDREKGFEAKYKNDQETLFRINARRDKLLGLWAAQKLGLAPGQPSDDYAKEVIVADLEEPGDDDVVRKVLKDLTAKGVKVSEADIWAELKRAADVARDQITKA